MRSDDAAGVLVGERLRKMGIEAQFSSGEAADLLDAWEDADDVVIVDAVVTGAPVGTLQVWDGAQPNFAGMTTASTHSFGAAEAIRLARSLHRLPARLTIYGIEGQRFDIGGEVSPEVERAVDAVAQRILADYRGLRNNASRPGQIPSRLSS